MSYAVQLRKRIAVIEASSGHVDRLDLTIPPEWLHEGQEEAWGSGEKQTAAIAGTQGGKTVLGPWWLLREAQLRGPMDYIIVGPTFTLLEKKAIPEFRRVFCDELGLGRFVQSPNPKFEASPEGLMKLFGKREGSLTVHCGHATNSNTLESMTLGGAWCDEGGQKEFKRDSYYAILRRLAVKQGRLLITSTPYDTTGWLKTEIWDKREKDEGIKVVCFESRMNPAFPKDEWDWAERNLPAWKFDLMYRGRFTRPAGAIFDNLDTARHCFDPKKDSSPSNWPHCFGLDFGGVNTAAVIGRRKLAADERRTEKVRITSEYWPKRQCASEAHAQAIQELLGKGQSGFGVGGSLQEVGWRSAFTAVGLPVYEPSFSGAGSVEARIQAVYSALAQDRLEISTDCEQLLLQMETYSRETDENGQALDAIDEKEKFHLVDALGYLVITLMPYLLEPDRTKTFEEPIVTREGIGKHLEQRRKERKRY